MKGLRLLQQISNNAIQYPERPHNEIFSLLFYKDLYWIAYKRIRFNLYPKGTISPKFTNSYANAINLLIKQLRNNQYYFEATANQIKSVRPRQRSTTLLLEYILQEVLCLILEAIYLPFFSSHNLYNWSIHNTHVVLESLEKQIRGNKYILRVQIEKNFKESDNQKIIVLLSQKIKDQRFLGILLNLLQTGYLNDLSRFHSLTERPENKGSHLYYILVDIFNYQIDHYIKANLISTKIKTTERKNLNNQRNYKINQLVNRKSFYSDKEISTQSEKIDQLMTGSLIYGNSILLFMVHEAEYQHVLWVKQKLDYFLQNNLKIKKDEKNFQIINLFKESFQFVGYEILVRKEKTFFKISISHIVNLLLRYKFIKYRKNGALRPISQTKLLAQPDFKIIQAYNHIVQCLTSYYSGISSNKRLQYCEYLLKFSCAMTLAHKHKTSISKIFRNHGSNLSLHSQPIENSYQFKSQHQNYLNIWQTTESFLDPFIIY